jgi:hypothetical protein
VIFSCLSLSDHKPVQCPAIWACCAESVSRCLTWWHPVLPPAPCPPAQASPLSWPPCPSPTPSTCLAPSPTTHQGRQQCSTGPASCHCQRWVDRIRPRARAPPCAQAPSHQHDLPSQSWSACSGFTLLTARATQPHHLLLLSRTGQRATEWGWHPSSAFLQVFKIGAINGAFALFLWGALGMPVWKLLGWW